MEKALSNQDRVNVSCFKCNRIVSTPIFALSLVKMKTTTTTTTTTTAAAAAAAAATTTTTTTTTTTITPLPIPLSLLLHFCIPHPISHKKVYIDTFISYMTYMCFFSNFLFEQINLMRIFFHLCLVAPQCQGMDNTNKSIVFHNTTHQTTSLFLFLFQGVGNSHGFTTLHPRNNKLNYFATQGQFDFVKYNSLWSSED